MIKLSNCKAIANASLDYDQFELYFDIITYTDNKRFNKMYNKLKDHSTIKLQSIKYQDKIVIIHNSTKKDNIIQVSYFDNKGAIMDTEKDSLRDAIKETYKSYKIYEVV